MTSYSSEGTSSLATGGARTTTSCYGTGNGTTCTADNYHTFVGWEKSIPVTGVELITQYTYNYSCAAPNSLTDPNNQTTTAGYDNLCRMNKVVKPGDSDTYPTIIINRYDNYFGQYADAFMVDIHQRVTAGSSTTFSQRKFYNGLGQLIQVQTPSAVVVDNACSTDSDTLPDTCDLVVDTKFDAYGNAIQQTVPYAIQAWYSGLTPTPYRDQQLSQLKTVSTYDALGRVLTVLAPDGTYPTRKTYSFQIMVLPDTPAVLPKTDVKDARNYTTSSLTDVWGRTVQVTPPTGPGVKYTYNALDQLTQVAYGGATTTFSYDFLGRKLTMSDPDMGSWTYTYDALNLTFQKDAKIQRICFYYDGLNRLTGKQYRSDDNCPPSNPTLNVAYSYDSGTNGKGQRTGMSDPSGSTAWTYDARGRMLSESKVITGSGTFKTQWTYNSADQVVTMTYPGNNSGGAGEQITFAYLHQNEVNTVTGSTTYVNGTTYDVSGRVVSQAIGTGLKTTYQYYPWTSQGGRLQYLKSGTTGSPTSLQYFSYSYDNVGNITSILDYNASGTQTQTFGYDSANRLTSAGASGGSGGIYGTESYTYDSSTGNLSNKAGVNYSYSVSATCPRGSFAPAHAVGTAGANTYCYDQNGNMGSRIIGGSSTTFTYDAEDHLTAVSGAASATFSYDGDDNRVKATVGGTTTAYIGNHFEWAGSTSTMKKYYYAGATRIAVRTGTGTGTTGLSFLFGDHLGSTSVSADSAGAKTSEVRYKAWGEDRYTSGSAPTDYRFTGQQWEDEFKLYYYGARWYDSALGRFVSPDSIIPASGIPTSWDHYAYSFNRPTIYTDPTGHKPLLDDNQPPPTTTPTPSSTDTKSETSTPTPNGTLQSLQGTQTQQSQHPYQPQPQNTLAPNYYQSGCSSTACPRPTPTATIGPWVEQLFDEVFEPNLSGWSWTQAFPPGSRIDTKTVHIDLHAAAEIIDQIGTTIWLAKEAIKKFVVRTDTNNNPPSTSAVPTNTSVP